MSVSFLTARKIKAAIALAVEDRKIPADKPALYRYGAGTHAEYGLFWSDRRVSARFNVRDDGSIYIGHASDYETGSHFAREFVAWSPLK